MEQLMKRKTLRIAFNRRLVLHCFCALLAVVLTSPLAFAQTPLPNEQRPPVNVAGHWVIEAKNWNGDFDTKTVDLEQNGAAITGHFKGPYQSGGLDGSINGHHIVFRTKTKHPLTFRGQVQGDTMEGNFHVMGKEGQFHAERTTTQ
jgi:hypothetical protein